VKIFNRIKKAFIIAFILTICTAGVVYAAWEYKYPTIVTDNSSVARTYVPIVLGWKGQTFVDAGKINSSANNTNMQIGGTSIKYMIATDNVACVIPSLGGNGQQTVDFYTGYSPVQTSFPIVLGNNGYVSVRDNVGIEFGSNGTATFNGYLDTTYGASRYDINKTGAFISGISTTTSGTVEASVYNVWPIISANGTSSSASGTSHAVSIGSPTVGELSIIFVNFYNTTDSPVITWATGYTQIFQKTSSHAGGHYQTAGAAYKVAIGTEGATVTVTTSSAATGTHGYYRLTAGTYSSTLITSGTAATGDSNAPDPPSCIAAHENANCLFIAFGALTFDGASTGTFITYPTNYTNGQLAVRVADKCAMGVASRYLNATSDNPGTFGIGPANPWIAQTICIYPGKATASTAGITSGEMKRTYSFIANYIPRNSSFERVSSGTTLSDWVVDSGIVERSSDLSKYGTYALKEYGGGVSSSHQSALSGTAGETITFGIYCLTNTANCARIAIYDPNTTTTTYSSYHTGNSQWQWLTVTAAIGAGASEAVFYIKGDTIDVSSFFDGAIAVIGTTIPNYWYNLNLYLDDVLSGSAGVEGGPIPDNTQSYQLLTDAPYTDNITISVNGTQQLYYSPSEMIKGKTYSTGNVSLTNGDATITGTGTTWTSSMAGGIFYSTGGATDNATYEISSITDTTHLELTSVYGGTTNSSQTYAMYARIPDEEATGGDNSGAVFWGTNSNVIISYGEMVSYASTSASTNETMIGFNSPDSPLPSTWFAGGENIENLPFYDSFISVSVSTGQPIQTIYFLSIIGFAFGAFLLLTMFTRSALLGAIGFNVVLFIGSSMTIIPMWIPFVTLIVMLGIMYLYRQVAY
jgi:hypothetical protein